MRKTLSLLILLLLSATIANALPSYWGLKGLNKVVDAQPIEVNQYSVGLFTHIGISHDDRNAVLNGTSFIAEDTEYDATGHLAFGYGINEMVEMAGRVSYWWNGYRRDLSNEDRDAGTGDWESDDALNEAVLSVKIAFNPTDDGQFWLGFMPSVGFSVSSGDNDYVTMYDAGTDGIWYFDDPMFEMRRAMLNTGKLNFGGDILTSYNADFGLGVHLNAGFHRYTQEFMYTDVKRNAAGGVTSTEDVELTVTDNAIRVAAGLEFETSVATPFVEVEYQRFLDRTEEAGNGERYDETAELNGGFRFASPYGIALDLTGSMALTSFDPEWSDLGHSIENPTDEQRTQRSPFPGGYPADFGAGVNLIFSSVLLEDPTHGTISGIVTDGETGEVVTAEVSFPASSVLPQTTVNGFYTETLLAGSIPMEVQAEGYLPYTETVVVVAGEDQAVDVVLSPVPDNGILTGTVTDAETGEVIVGAAVMVQDMPEGLEASVVTNASGVYAIEIPEGNWTVKVQAEDYLDVVKVQVMAVEVTTVFDVEMRPALVEGQVLSFNNIYFESGSAQIKPESFGVLDTVAQTLMDNEGVNVRIAGHTDSDGSASYNQGLSERRAAAVLDYLVRKGVAGNTLTTIGYGEENPVVPNTSAANKAQNRRIEFTVLGAAIR